MSSGMRSMSGVLAGMVLAVSACATPNGLSAKSTSFDLVGQGWVRLPMRVAGATGAATVRVMFDTGGGVTLLSKALCDRVGCVPDGTFTGKRMSGQDVTLPMARFASLELAGHRMADVRVAVLDSPALIDPALGIEGVAALDLFRERAFTLEYPRQRLVVEDAASTARRRAQGRAVKVRVEHDGPSTVVYLPVQLAGVGRPLEMEVDNGSRDMILDDAYMQPLGIDPAAPSSKRVEGTDQTGHSYVRTYARVTQPLGVVGLPEVRVPAGASVMFQRIIHDGLLGHDFLRGRIVTFALAHGELVFAR